MNLSNSTTDKTGRLKDKKTMVNFSLENEAVLPINTAEQNLFGESLLIRKAK